MGACHMFPAFTDTLSNFRLQFLAMRKTLEANMHMANLFPPGRVLWALREGDLDPAQRLPTTQAKGADKLRLFEVQDVEQVFGQIVFAKDMLRYVFPRIAVMPVIQSFC